MLSWPEAGRRLGYLTLQAADRSRPATGRRVAWTHPAGVLTAQQCTANQACIGGRFRHCWCYTTACYRWRVDGRLFEADVQQTGPRTRGFAALRRLLQPAEVSRRP
jgi:hypothetical protein